MSTSHDPNRTAATDDVVARFWRKAESHVDSGASGEGTVQVMRQGDDNGGGGLGRRRFLQMMGTSLAIPSMAACTRQPKEEIVPYVKQPEQIVPGRPLFYATATLLGGLARGVLVETHMGRPTKVEGNPEHPASRGGTDAIGQAEILELYDPDRSQTVLHNGAISSWVELASKVRAGVLGQRGKRGAGLRILTGEVTSPTLIGQIDALLTSMPLAKWHIHEAVDNDAERHATAEMFGRALEARYHFDRADVVLSLDADFLMVEGNPRYLHDYSQRRVAPVRAGKGRMNRHYAVQSAAQLTAANADERVIVPALAVEAVARLVAAKVLEKLGKTELAQKVAGGASQPVALSDAWLDAVSKDLVAAGERAVVVPGRFQSPIVHRVAHTLNEVLGALGKTVSFADPVRASARGNVGSLDELTSALHAGKVELLLVMGTNPVYSAEHDKSFADAMAKATLRVHHGLRFDETATLCHWHVPATHPFEHWGDVRSYDGTISIVQPLIEPLYASKSEHELLAVLGDNPDRSGYQVVRDYWRALWPGDDFDPGWRRMVHDGLLAQSEKGAATLRATNRPWPKAAPAPSADALELVLRPDPYLYDGRFANNGWLQEVPRPLSQLTWDNAAIMAPALAAKLGVQNGDVVLLEAAGGKLEAPVWTVPGSPSNSVTLHLGYGRQWGGKVLKNAGVNAYRLRSSAARWHVQGLSLTKTGKTYELASAQLHGKMEGRNLARSATLAEYREHGADAFTEHGHHTPVSLYPDHAYPGYAWGLSIDLTSCVGCSACLVACQSENNVPIVGKEEVLVGREMHWIRIDRYYEGDDDNPDTRLQPVPCMHCESAPCEVVCPVAATVHHDEGLNDMVYNRCVGTKYCANNCPYKVRRFNFFPYSVEAVAPLDPTAPSMKLLHNPDVTVRSYGVMEKCSYCVQRINYARVGAKREGRSIRDGDVMSACQAACPAKAITFGNINDANAEVTRRKKEARNYTLLEELNNKPRTSYLARVTNPGVERAGGKGAGGKGAGGTEGAH